MATQTLPGKPLITQTITDAGSGTTAAVIRMKEYEGQSEKPVRAPTVRRLER
jgi:hypothetical protein